MPRPSLDLLQDTPTSGVPEPCGPLDGPTASFTGTSLVTEFSPPSNVRL